jgi:hypothetical protein
MAPQIGRAQLQTRLDTYLVDRVLNLHNILVGVALGWRDWPQPTC